METLSLLEEKWDNSKSHEVLVFVDGGCRPNPGRGAWAAVVLYRWVPGHSGHSSNERAHELVARVLDVYTGDAA